ncbi:MAG: hypothetical protein JXR76_12045 [Deltaproteobacteria bacterium]|nr:hypothetical protein [Deltaproteobacteria bacterium]
MVLKISLVLNGLLLILGIFVAVQQRDLSTTVELLTHRVTDLEVQNVQLSKQLEWASKGDSGMPGAQRFTASQRNQSFKSTERQGGRELSPDTVSGDGADAGDIENLKAHLRQEVEEMVAQEQNESSEKRRQEWQERMRDGMTESLNDFAEDQHLEGDVKVRLSVLLNESMEKRQKLRDELHNRNLSFYEYRQEERKMREEMESNLSNILDEEQVEAFEDAFPMGPRGRRGQP